MSGGVLEARDATGLAFGCRMTGALVTPAPVWVPLPACASRSQLEYAAGDCRQDSGQWQTGAGLEVLALDCLRQSVLSGWSCPDAPFRETPDFPPDKVKRLEAGSRQGIH